VAFRRWRATSLTAREAAARLGVEQSRVRQMLGERSLLGFKDGNEWRLLELQFADDQLVPNIRQVVRALPAELPISAAANWLMTPEPDLELDGEPVSPLRWLTEGGPADPVVALAADL
jgi:excisionase family DNA binding protein